MDVDDVTLIKEVKSGQRATVVGRTGFRGPRRARLRKAEVVISDPDGNGIVLQVRGFMPGLVRPVGQLVKATGLVRFHVERGWPRMVDARVERMPGPQQVVVFRSFACQTCRGPIRDPQHVWGGGYIGDLMGLRGEGFLPVDRTEGAIRPCPDCDGQGFVRYQAKGYFAASRWAATLSLLVAAAIGWLLHGLF